MFSIPQKVLDDMKNFVEQGLTASAEKGLLNSKDRAHVVSFKGEMERGIHLDKKSKDNVQVISGTKQGERFETGYEGIEPVTPLIREWAEHVKANLPATAKTIHVDYKDTRFRVDTREFMRKSIPTEAQISAELDRVINSTMRGGTVYG